MGHQRLGKLPTHRYLPDIVRYLVTGGTPTAHLVEQITEVGRDALKRALKDPVFVEALWLLIRLPQAAASRDFGAALAEIGMGAQRPTSVAELMVAFDNALERVQRREHRDATDLGEIARQAALTALGDAVRAGMPMWSPTADDVQASVAALRSPEKFGALAHHFHANTVERVIHYYVDRNLHELVGADRVFRNTVLGETWIETGDAPDWQRIAERREDWPAGTVPAGGLFLTAGADVQKDRIEVDVWAWGRGLESWLVDHVVIEGGPARPEAWEALTDLLGRSWRHAGGAELGLARLAIDTGYETAAVYGWARSVGFAQVAPVKGLEGFNRASPVSGPTFVDATAGGKRLRRGARLWTVATSTFKAETYRFLRLARPTSEELSEGAAFPPGTVHLPGWADTEWIRQLTAEQLVTVRNRRGFAKLEWQKLRERNEALDCRVYARAAAWIAGVDRWPEATWADLEAQLGVPSGMDSPAGLIGRPDAGPQGKRRSDWLGRREGWF